MNNSPVPVWLPPNWGPFVSFHDRDESWARPLGLGRVVDLRPTINQAAKRMQQHTELMMYGERYK